ncbi:hypothetical protein ACHQM5_019455 [Ranunculus cassubicifolius]
MGGLYFIICYTYVLFLLSQEISIRAYTLNSSQSLIDGTTLVSKGGNFELGFFNRSNSKNRYLGIWYKRVSVQTVVWVANRDTPLNDTAGALKIGSTGNIVILSSTESVIWSSNASNSVENRVIEFLDTGNLVLRAVKTGEPANYLWQSFDHPGDTLLPGMTLGLNLKTGADRYMSSWRNSDDPSYGDYTFGIGQIGYLDWELRNGSNKYCRSGPWNGLRFSGAHDMSNNHVFKYEVIHNSEEVYYTYQLLGQSVILRLVLAQTNTDCHLQRLTWVNLTQSWHLLVSIPRDRCDDYALCGAYSTCEVMNEPVCQCLKGFKPKSPQDWDKTDWSQGCVRETFINCSQGEGFLKFAGVKLPDTTGTWIDDTMKIEECRAYCLKNCSCVAYSSADISGGGSGCILWFRDLIDIRQMDEAEAGQDLYVRMAASELVPNHKSRTKKHVAWIVIATPVVVVVVVLGLGGLCIWKKRRPKGDYGEDELELPLYELVTLKNATDNFNEKNKLGEGGFGPVYKGKLEGEQDIAVKRLSKNSRQGFDEFKNEVILISKLQHNNLVKLLGCCIHGDEKMLVYEYMPNKSLDSFIFDKTASKLLDWKKRFNIILGIARGLLYLHHDSRLKIIHRDLKASNVLLDSEMLPKISDFGMARLFKGDQYEANTKRIMGTYGYMSPEYAIDGNFSVKSDVFSFGVLVLELISEKKNRGFRHPDHDLNLLGHAWILWNEEKSMELVDDESMRNLSFIQEITRCIHIGLLCVQKDVDERPTMSLVVTMLCSENVVLPNPQIPGFYVGRSKHGEGSSSYRVPGFSTSYCGNTSLIEGR